LRGADVTNERLGASYALGYTTEENNRLMRQAALLAPCSERLFRAAGIGPGDRVLDLGSGVGDVSLLVARLVGPTGIVIGVERSAESIAQAEARVAAAGLGNVSFRQGDATEVAGSEAFDAIIGRFILMYLREPAQTLRRLKPLLRPSSTIAFLEPSWAAARGLSAHLPLYSACAGAIVAAFRASGVNPEMGGALHRAYVDAGLPAPTMTIEILLGADEEFTRALCDILRSLEPAARRSGVPLETLGDFSTLQARLQSELQESGDPIAWLAGHVGAWSRLTG
jgi:SAM-dependent methyltransferase